MVEDLVVSLDRAMRFGVVLERRHRLALWREEVPPNADIDRVRRFRNRIAHGDDRARAVCDKDQWKAPWIIVGR
jgi:hypothetical protein